jgi:hypothetical protein
VIELPRSPYYYHPHSSEDGLTDERLAALIDDVHDVFPGYGYRRVTRELAARGIAVNHKRIARVMRQYGLGAIRRRRFVRTTDSRHDCPIFPNLYRNSIPKSPNKVWVADIIYVALASGLRFSRPYLMPAAAKSSATLSDDISIQAAGVRQFVSLARGPEGRRGSRRRRQGRLHARRRLQRQRRRHCTIDARHRHERDDDHAAVRPAGVGGIAAKG